MKKFLFLCGLLLTHFQAQALSPEIPVIRDIYPADTLCTMDLETNSRADYGLASYKNHFLLLDKQGHWHILGKINSESTTPYSCTHTLAAIYQNNQWHIYDGETGKQLSQNNQHIEDVATNVAMFDDFIELKQNGKWSVWRKKNGQLIRMTPSQYDGFGMGNIWSSRIPRNDHTADDIQYFQATVNGKWGVINQQGHWIVPAQYQEGQILLYKHLITISTQKYIYDIFDFSGKKLMQIDERQFEPFYYPELKGLILKDKKIEKYGFMNFQKQWVLPLKYDLIDEPAFNRALILKNKREGFINEEGKIVIPMVFDYIENSNVSGTGFAINGELKIAAKNIGNCSLFIDAQGVLIDNTFFSCSSWSEMIPAEHLSEWQEAEKPKAIQLLKSRGYPIKWRKLPENIDTVQPPKPNIVRDPLPDLPDVEMASETKALLENPTPQFTTEPKSTW